MERGDAMDERLMDQERRRLARQDAAVEKARRQIAAARVRLEKVTATHRRLMQVRREAMAARRRERRGG